MKLTGSVPQGRFESMRGLRNFEELSVSAERIVLLAQGVWGPNAPAIPVEIVFTGKLPDRPAGLASSAVLPAAASSPCGSGCSPELSQVAFDLETYLNTLLVRRMMFSSVGKPVEIFPNNDTIFRGVFHGSVLYPADPPQARLIQHVVRSQTATRVDFAGLDNAGFQCDLMLAKVSGPERARIADLVSIRNLRLDPIAPSDQPVFDFYADAVFLLGRDLVAGVVRGRSCNALNVCGSKCELLLYGVCVLSYPDATHNDTISTQTSVTEQVQTMVNAFNGSLQPIWRPYTNYAVVLKTQDTLYRENTSSVDVAHPVRTSVFAFRTAGPLGHFHSYLGAGDAQVERDDFHKLKLLDRQDEFKLKDVLHYVDFEKCYPNADGQLLNAKPLFYIQPKLSVFFLKSYTYEMMRSWDDLPGSDGTDVRFAVTVKDPAPDPNDTQQSPAEITWERSSLPVISTEITVINNMITYGSPCANVSIIDPLWVTSAAQLPDLRPSKLYTAIFNVSLKRKSAPDSSFVVQEVLRYAFQTSRYASFEQQVNSWRLKVTGSVVDKAAVFTMKFTAQTDTATLAEQILADTLSTDHNLRKDFGDPFNRLVDGVFQLTSLHPPTTTEFNAVREEATGRIFGLLIRNPEPFNDPKMPSAAIASTLLASMNGSPTGAWKVLWSKDRSQAFLTNTDNSLNIAAGSSAVFTFVYKQWDGGAYATLSTVVTSAIQLP
jgi:hypothetical protein